jgi:hypothetical protein
VFEARALTLRGVASDRQGAIEASDRAFRTAFEILETRGAQAELAETCARYSDVLRSRDDADGALAFMRMAYARDFANLSVTLRAVRARGNRARRASTER